MKRAWILSCILGLSVVLSGCGKGEPQSRAQTPGYPAEAIQQVRAEQPAVIGGQTQDGLPAAHIAQLPGQAVATLRLIEAGGPFPYEKDGIVFGNRERLLPRRPRGYYHEYTVSTPRSRDRGARRIVCGGSLRQIGDCDYTDDHYASFKRIADQPRD